VNQPIYLTSIIWAYCDSKETTAAFSFETTACAHER